MVMRERTSSSQDTAQAHIILRKQSSDHRKADLGHAAEHDELLRGRSSELRSGLDTLDTDRVSVLPRIEHYRTQHAQSLDSLFPIQSVHPPTLLYTILDVPLPIPTGPKDPAPPITVPPSALPTGYKVDERTTAAALGYAALAIQLIGHLGGTTSGLPYPITCAGSRSLVKDIVSVMQGPRS